MLILNILDIIFLIIFLIRIIKKMIKNIMRIYLKKIKKIIMKINFFILVKTNIGSMKFLKLIFIILFQLINNQMIQKILSNLID